MTLLTGSGSTPSESRDQVSRSEHVASQRGGSGADVIELPFGRVPRGRHLDLDRGGQAFVRTVGTVRTEPPVLLLHGLGATGALNWAGCFDPLARRTQVIAVDHRGHGRGPRVG